MCSDCLAHARTRAVRANPYEEAVRICAVASPGLLRVLRPHTSPLWSQDLAKKEKQSESQFVARQPPKLTFL